MPLSLRNGFVLILALLGALWLPLAAQTQTPEPTGRVTDLAAVLSAEDNLLLVQMLAGYERETTHQIAILTVPSLSGESIEVFSLRAAKAWALGRKGVSNGILIVLAPTEHRVRIELGRGFERYISNTQAGEIIQTQMLPAFRENEYSKGLERGLQELMKQGRALVVPKQPESRP
jgi:uncharacterized protein